MVISMIKGKTPGRKVREEAGAAMNLQKEWTRNSNAQQSRSRENAKTSAPPPSGIRIWGKPLGLKKVYPS